MMRGTKCFWSFEINFVGQLGRVHRLPGTISGSSNEILTREDTSKDGIVEETNDRNSRGCQLRDNYSLLRYGSFSMEVMGKRSYYRFLYNIVPRSEFLRLGVFSLGPRYDV